MRHRVLHRLKTNHTGHFPRIRPVRSHRHPVPRRNTGFALVVTLSLMILLTIIAVGLLSLSAVSLRSSSQGNAQAEAKANARLALMIAIGELQKEMGPDMRVSAESALLDGDYKTEEIDAVAQSHWLGSYDSWGDWLNASYTHTRRDGSSSTENSIAGTYAAGRGKMFRRWLLSLPDVATEENPQSPVPSNHANDKDWVALVDTGSLGTSTTPDRITRAYLTKVVNKNVTTGKYAWWVGGENQKARIDMAKKPPRTPDTAAAWEISQGDTAEVGVGVLDGFDALDTDSTLGDKLITTQTLIPAQITEAKVKEHFFDLTASSRGVLASVRTGHLKKDLSLLFERDKSDLPDTYRFDNGDIREPSIRPMSSEIATKPALPSRHFASWTRMRHFYRMYRQDSDAMAPSYTNGGIDGSAELNWNGSKPWTDCNLSHFNANNGDMSWDNQDTYMRFPILTNATYILSLLTQRPSTTSPYNLYCVSTPVYVFWNPYNVEMSVPNSRLWVDVDFTTLQPMLGRIIKNSVPQTGKLLLFSQDRAGMKDDQGKIIFKPGEFRAFTAEPGVVNDTIGTFAPGFNPLALGGMRFSLGTSSGSDDTRLGINFSPVSQNGKLFNSQFGSSPGSFFTKMSWEETNGSSNNSTLLPFHCHVDWLDESNEQAFAPITRPGSEPGWIFDGQPYPVGFIQLALKSNFSSKDGGWYDTINWSQDWRCRNWIQAPPFYLGKGLYLSNDPDTANTQRMDCPYEFRFGSLLGREPADIIQHYNGSAFLSENEKVNAVACLELPTAPIGSLAGFAAMRIEPGWTKVETINPEWRIPRSPSGTTNTTGNTLQFATSKVLAYQSGITGPGIGNSFLHPMISRTDVYRKFDNSNGSEPKNFQAVPTPDGLSYPYTYGGGYSHTDNKAYCDYWDHVLLLNDALWDDYFVSSLADQTSAGESARASLADNLKKLANGEELANSRYMPYPQGRSAAEVKTELDAAEGYLKAAKYLMVDGLFNVNSTSVAAWHALFAGIRERKVVYRDQNGTLKPVANPPGKIVLSRFNTATTDQETTDPEEGINRDDGLKAWSGVRFLDDAQLQKLAQECVKQVKQRGPFLNFSEFINRRLSNDDLGTMGALQSAIDYDDASPEAASINYDFKSLRDFRIEAGDLGANDYKTPEAAVGSRYAGIPGYVIQSDLLKPIANTLAVRDDTFRIRAYGEALDASGKVTARAWCEAVVQRLPEYQDPTNEPEVAARLLDANSGTFSDNSALSVTNRLFGRKFRIESFRWLSGSEI